MIVTTRVEREKAVAQANANARIEGFEPDAEDLAMQQQFVDGTLTVEELLEAARKEALTGHGEEP